MKALSVLILAAVTSAYGEANPLDSNLAYWSPFVDHPQVSN
jgi:hypothetical protein